MKSSKLDGLDLTQYTKTFASFSGADMIASFDGNIIGEVQAVRWEQELGTYSTGEVKGVIECAVFDRESLEAYENKEFDILIRFMNEYGQSKLEFIKGVRLKSKKGGASVDDICQVAVYTFQALDAIVISEISPSAKENLSFIFNNYHSKDQKTCMKVEAYVALMSYSFEMRHFEVVNAGELSRLRKAEQELNNK